jgi:hypothetical protein
MPIDSHIMDLLPQKGKPPTHIPSPPFAEQARTARSLVVGVSIRATARMTIPAEGLVFHPVALGTWRNCLPDLLNS